MYRRGSSREVYGLAQALHLPCACVQKAGGGQLASPVIHVQND